MFMQGPSTWIGHLSDNGVENASSFEVSDDRLFPLGIFVPHVKGVIGAIHFWGYLVGLREGVGWVVGSAD